MNPTNISLQFALYGEQYPPTIVDEINDDLMYVGYCLPTSTINTSDKVWFIKRIKKVWFEDGKRNIQTILYSNGCKRFNCSWDERFTIPYKLSSDASEEYNVDIAAQPQPTTEEQNEV